MGCRSKKQVYAKFRLIVRKNKRREKLRAYLADVAAGVPPPCPVSVFAFNAACLLPHLELTQQDLLFLEPASPTQANVRVCHAD